MPGEYRDKVVFLGDFNARVGRGGDTGSPFAAVLGDGLAADVGHVDDSATSLLNFCVAQGYEVADSWFSNAEVGSATWVSRRYSPDWFTLNGAAMSKVMARQWRTRKAYLAAPVYRNIFVEQKFRKTRPCIILLYIRINGLQNIK